MGLKTISAGLVLAAMTAAVSTSALAGTKIKNASDCEFEGGTMTNVKGSDYCLVQIRPAEYTGEEYDGNQLGVTDCPGDKLNKGVFCMYPVTIRKQTPAPVAPTPGIADQTGALLGDGADASIKNKAGAAIVKNEITGDDKSTADVLVDVVKDEAKKKAEDEAKKAAGSLLGDK